MKQQAQEQLIQQLNFLVKAGPTKIVLQPWQVQLLGGRFTYRDNLPHYANIPVEVVTHA